MPIFWISDSHLYHAYAWLKLFNLQKSYNKNLSQKDLQLIASSVLLAALSVAPYGHKYGASHLHVLFGSYNMCSMALESWVAMSSALQDTGNIFLSRPPPAISSLESYEMSEHLTYISSHDRYHVAKSEKIINLL